MVRARKHRNVVNRPSMELKSDAGIRSKINAVKKSINNSKSDFSENHSKRIRTRSSSLDNSESPIYFSLPTHNKDCNLSPKVSKAQLSSAGNRDIVKNEQIAEICKTEKRKRRLTKFSPSSSKDEENDSTESGRVIGDGDSVSGLEKLGGKYKRKRTKIDVCGRNDGNTDLEIKIHIQHKSEVTTGIEEEPSLDTSVNSNISISPLSEKRENRMRHKLNKHKSKKKRQEKKKGLERPDLSAAEWENNANLNEASAASDLDEETANNETAESDECINTATPEDVRCFCQDLHKDYYGLLLPTQNQIIGMSGFFKVAVIQGEVDITGYKMLGSDGEPSFVEIGSPNTSSLYYIKDSSPPCSKNNRKRLLEKIASMFDSSKEKIEELMKDVTEIHSCVLLQKIYSPIPQLLERLNETCELVKKPVFYSEPFNRSVMDTTQWKTVVDDIEKEMVLKMGVCNCSIMVCGGADVGKSSLARYMINRLLRSYEAVYYLDCDCGQTEFTPPSLLSLVKVTKPVLGVPFSHLMKPLKSYCLGHVSPRQVPTEYIKLIECLFQEYHCNYYSSGPLLINLQGWIRGLGLQLVVDCIRLTSPCYVIQINSTERENLNSPSDLCDEYITKESGWHIDRAYQSIKEGHGREYIVLKTTDAQKSALVGKKHKSRTIRQQNITSYFSPLYQSNLDEHTASGRKYFDWIPPPISALLPYIIRWQDVALHVMHEKVSQDVMLHCFNMALVSMAYVDPQLIKIRDEDSELPNYLIDQPVAEHIGFGIVRNIDPVKKLFYIITPEPAECWMNVNALLKGISQLPASYLLEDPLSNRPYYCMDYISVASKAASVLKPRFNLKRRPSKMRSGGSAT